MLVKRLTRKYIILAIFFNKNVLISIYLILGAAVIRAWSGTAAYKQIGKTCKRQSSVTSD